MRFRSPPYSSTIRTSPPYINRTEEKNYMNKLLIFFLVLISCNVYSQDYNPDQLSIKELDDRFLYIKSRLENERNHNYLWQYGWEGFYASSSLVQLSLAATADNSDDEIRFGVGAFKSALAFSAMLRNPLPTIDGANSLSSPSHNHSNIQPHTRAQKIERLKRAEALFKRGSERAKSIHTWSRHGTAILFNLATAGIVSAFGNDKDAIASAIGGILASEINIWTQPSQGIQDWQDYQSFKSNDSLSWKLLPTLNGLALSLNF